MRTLPNAVELLANSSYSESKFSSITSGKLHDLDYNRTPRRRSIYFYIFGVWSLYDVQMSSKVNNKVPHTSVNSTGTSFVQAQAKMAMVCRSLFTPPFWIWSEENWVEDRNTWMNWHQTSILLLFLHINTWCLPISSWFLYLTTIPGLTIAKYRRHTDPDGRYDQNK